MALTIRLAPVFFVSALAAGCSQSLFDANLGGDDPTGDGGNPAPDASSGGRDGGGGRDSGPDRPDARVTDAGRVEPPDARIPGICPEPCAGDAYADFDGTSGGRNGRWRYVEVSSSYDFVEMTSTTYPGTAAGWIGTGASPPGVAYCPVASDQLPCGDQANTLVFITTPAAAATNPGVGWTAPMAGDYRLIVDWKFPSTAPLVSSLFYLISGESDIYEFSTDTGPGTYDMRVTLAEGDTVTLTSFSNTNTSTSLAVNFYINGPLSPAAFQGSQQ